MKLVVFGGTVFLSRAVAEEAVRRAHRPGCRSGGIARGREAELLAAWRAQ